MKLEKIALITENSKLARFFELELALLPYKLSPLSTIAEADSEYDCLIVDSDTVKDVVGGFSCPVITVSSRFERVEVFPHSRMCTLPYPVPMCEIVRLLRDVECDIFDGREAERDYNTVYVTDHNTNSIMVENLQLKLTPSELAVLDALCSSSGRLVERERISALLGARIRKRSWQRCVQTSLPFRKSLPPRKQKKRQSAKGHSNFSKGVAYEHYLIRCGK